MQSQAWTRYFQMLVGLKIPQFSGEEFAEYMLLLHEKRQQQQIQRLELIFVTPSYFGRITLTFLNWKSPKQVSFKDALGGLFEPGRQINSSSVGPSYQQDTLSQNMNNMLHPQALKPIQQKKENDRYVYDSNDNEIDMYGQDHVQHSQQLLGKDGSLLIQEIEQLRQFNWEHGEEDALRQISSMPPHIRMPEDAVSEISRKRSLQVKARDHQMSTLSQKVFNYVRLEIAVLNCGQLEDGLNL
ncbi:MAG: hypothetical protein EZS28_003572 [Streblomastix strix]|uniref:Uncharacterized protein n=1 Tax=Streblomastix strix TaxID=222440 RepID=A0A5J4X169_9EUKA|nr:MAG: hypothetical protein EZS28_003572 [Streblomastix strix]